MSEFERNILSIYQERGRAWLASLPKKVEQIAALWGLNDLKPFEHLTYNYVLSGYQNDIPIVLKLSIDETSLKREAEALLAFANNGAVAVLKQSQDALLLQRAIPGNLLKNHFPTDSQLALKVACEVTQKLHQAPLPKEHSFPLMKHWMTVLDKDWQIPTLHLQTARALKCKLIEKEEPLVLLHGDLHLNNILSNGKEWLIIDPKGVIGSPIHEMWAFVEDPKKDLPFISDYFGFNFEQLVASYYVRVVMAACWQVQDRLDPKRFLTLAEIASSLMR